MKGNRYRVSLPGMEIYSDGRTSWNYDKSANEVTVSGVDVSANAMTPQKLFTNFYDKAFFYKLNGEKKVGAKTVQEIEMTPTDKTKPFHKIYVLVDKATSKFTARVSWRKAATDTATPSILLSRLPLLPMRNLCLIKRYFRV